MRVTRFTRDDGVVIEGPAHLTQAEAHFIADQWRRTFGHGRVMILGGCHVVRVRPRRRIRLTAGL